MTNVSDLEKSLVAHMVDESHVECVGLVLEDGNTIRLKNQARSPHRFFVNPVQFTDIHHQFTAPVAALYHSHPHRPSIPSGEDRRMMRYLKTVWPSAYHIILSPSGHAAFHVVDNDVVEERGLPWSSRPDH